MSVVKPKILSETLNGLFLLELLIRMVIKRRFVPPCIRLRGVIQFNVNWVIINFFVFIFVVYQGREFSPASMMGIARILMLISIAGISIMLLCDRMELCANGLWYNGTLHEWDDYESFLWKKEGNEFIAELMPTKKAHRLLHHSTRLVVPPESQEDVKRLLKSRLLEIGAEQ